MRESKVTVKIPRPLYRKIQQVVDGSGFNSPTDFIVFVLRDLMGDAAAAASAAEAAPQSDQLTPSDPATADQAAPATGQEFTQEEVDDVRRKLENLGYL